jgi:hypothetical protein
MATHDLSAAQWIPKSNPFDSHLSSGVQMPVPYNEVHRLERLRAYKLTEMAFEEQYTTVVQLAMRLFQTEVGLVGVHDEADVHLKVNVGIMHGACSAARSGGFCSFALMPETPDVFVVKDASKDIRYLMYGVEGYCRNRVSYLSDLTAAQL